MQGKALMLVIMEVRQVLLIEDEITLLIETSLALLFQPSFPQCILHTDLKKKDVSLQSSYRAAFVSLCDSNLHQQSASAHATHTKAFASGLIIAVAQSMLDSTVRVF